MVMHRCGRCAQDVQGEFDHPKLRRWSRLYFLLPLPFIPFAPLIAADYVVMIPLSMLYMIGVGSALRFATEKPICPTCGVFVDPK